MTNLMGLLKAAGAATLVSTLIATVAIPHHFFDLFSHFRLQYLGASLLLLIGFAAFREKPYVIAMLTSVLINAAVIAPWYMKTDVVNSGTPLKLIHANVLSSNSNHQALVDFVHAEDPDVVFLQEFNEQWLEGSKPLLERYPHVYTQPRSGNFGIAVFSKFPFSAISHVDSPPFDHPTLIAELSVQNTDITLISTHPMIPLGGKLASARNEQLDSIAAMVRNNSEKIVLLGDFNASIWDRRYKQLEEETGLRSSRRGFGIAPSWPTFMLPAMIPIDHVLVSEDIGVVNNYLGRRIGSDHLPLVVTLAL